MDLRRFCIVISFAPNVFLLSGDTAHPARNNSTSQEKENRKNTDSRINVEHPAS